MMDPASEPALKRISRHVVLSIAAPVLFLSGYLGSYLAIHSATNDSSFSRYVRPVYESSIPLWRPIRSFERSGLPLSAEFHALDIWCWNLGTVPWNGAREEAARQKRVRESSSR